MSVTKLPVIRRAFLCFAVILCILLFFGCGEKQRDLKAQSETIDCREIAVKSWTLQTENENLSDLKEDETALFHNDGEAIETDLFEKGKSGGNALVAVYCTKHNGTIVQSYYFTTAPGKSKTDLLHRIAAEEWTLAYEIPEKTDGCIIRNYHWEAVTDSKVQATFHTGIRMQKKPARIDEKTGTVWDIKGKI